MSKRAVGALGAFTVCFLLPPMGLAQDGDAGRSSGRVIEQVIVTAQKRAESINEVAMSISAASADTLAERGVLDTSDLAKIVPGFTYTPSAFGPPIYTLRGIGLFESGVASPPAVSVYVDEVPLAFPVMAQAASLDIERVEVLKGPQGILFGQNSTGGAINYVAAKPTATPEAGASLTWSRFNQVHAEGFVSGPLTDTLSARLAVRTVQGGEWQKSQSRPWDKRGDQDRFAGRLLLDWQPTERLALSMNLNGFQDQSETQAPQLIEVIPANPAAPNAPELLQYTGFGKGDSRIAEWSPNWRRTKDDEFWQLAVRADYDLSDSVVFTSITSYQDMRFDTYTPGTALPIENIDFRLFGFIESFNQEFRLTGDAGWLRWLAGVNYESADIEDRNDLNIPQLSVSASPLPGIIPPLTLVQSNVLQEVETYAIFANTEFDLTDRLVAQIGVRYTESDRDASNCTFDRTPQNGGGQLFELIQLASGKPAELITPIGPGQCYTLTPLVTDANGTYVSGLDAPQPTKNNLKEDNVSWRVGLQYFTDADTLLYINNSRGWKAGTFTNVSGSTTSQYDPVVHERVDAWEAGFKAPLLGGQVQLNGAAFHYDYKDKQIRGRDLDAVFGMLETLVNVPESRIWGVEGELVARPLDGLDVSIAALYLDTEVTGAFQSYNQAGQLADYKGAKLPFSPKWSGVADIQYSFMVGNSLSAFAGATLTYQDKQMATFATSAAPEPDFGLQSRTLLDVRVGVRSQDDSWAVTLFGRNVTDEYYETLVFQSTDVRYRYSGMPATWGVSLDFRLN